MRDGEKQRIKNQLVSNLKLPRYIRFLGGALIPLAVIPIFSWLLVATYFRDLPELAYKQVLESFWLLPVALIFVIWAVGMLAVILLKVFGTHVVEKNDTGLHLKPVKDLYLMYLDSPGWQRILIMYLIYTQFFTYIGAGWAAFGGIVWFFSINVK